MGRYAERKQEQTTRTKQTNKHTKTTQNTNTYEALAKLCLVVTDEKGQQASKPASQQARSR